MKVPENSQSANQQHHHHHHQQQPPSSSSGGLGAQGGNDDDGYHFTLYSHRGAPNGFKVATVMSELGLRYRTVFIDFKQGDHRKAEFIRICPNARIPALVDHRNDDFAIWEVSIGKRIRLRIVLTSIPLQSGAILLYLVNMYDVHHKLWPADKKEQSQVTSWIMLQVSGHSVIVRPHHHHHHHPSSTLEGMTDSAR